MTRCPSCGANSIFLSTKTCFGCGETICDRCMPKTLETLSIAIGSQEDHPYETVGFCSDDCYNQFLDRILHFDVHKYVLTDSKNIDANIVNAWNKAIANSVHSNFKKLAENACRIHSMQHPAFPWWDPKTNTHLRAYSKFYKDAKMAFADNLIKCGRTDDAAAVYEEQQMYNKAKELREINRQVLVKSTNVSVNINTLLQQLKDGGIVAVYRCPFCGGKLKINKETTADTVRHCEHCGSEISTMDIEDFLKTALT